MDDLNAKISEILSDPESMKQLQGLASMLGTEPGIHTDPSPVPDPPPLGGVNADSMQMITRLMPMLSSVSQQDDTTRLLAAIRPFLSAERQTKLDEASKLLRMMRLLPMLKDFNLLGL